MGDAVINDPTGASPGFRYDLAGKTIKVEGDITGVESKNITQGVLNFLELDNFPYLRLAVWGAVDRQAGDGITMDVSLEWSNCNDESHVYSPQLDWPVAAYLPAVGKVVDEVNVAAGTMMFATETDDGSIEVTVFDQSTPRPLEGVTCSLSAGVHSWAAEHVDFLGIGTPGYVYGHPLDRISDLSAGVGENGSARFYDVDHDGNLSTGNRFEIGDLRRPTIESGVYTYAMVVGFESNGLDNRSNAIPKYIIMNSRGLLAFDRDTP